jgi:hypothetical protein
MVVVVVTAVPRVIVLCVHLLLCCSGVGHIQM